MGNYQKLFSCLVLFTAFTSTLQADDGASILDRILPGIEGYQTHVEVRSTLMDKAEFYDEYHDVQKGKGVLRSGDTSTYYYRETDQSVAIKGSRCTVYEQYDAWARSEFDWLWEEQSHTIIGFSAVLWRKLKDQKNIGQESVRNILCDKYSATDDVTNSQVVYYYSAKEWLPANGLSSSIPVRVVVDLPPQDGEKVQVQFDFTYWSPNRPAQSNYNIPVGIGCDGLKSPKSTSIPSLEEQLSFTMENYKELQKGTKTESDVNLEKIWYDDVNQLVRVDGTYNVSTQVKPFREVLDFVTGVTYLIYDSGKCLIKPINQTFALSNTQLNSLKSPRELLKLNPEKLTFIGNDVQRGIDCEIWESISYNYLSTTGHKIDKAVFTYYFSSPNVIENSEGDDNSRVPVTILVNAYRNGTEKPIARVITNYFKFDQADYRPFHEYMSVEECFVAETARSFFVIDFPANNDTVAIARANHHQLQVKSVLTIANNAGARPFRIPYIEVFYQEDKLQVLGLIVGRPAYISGFILDLDQRASMSTYAMDSSVLKMSGDEEACAKNCFNQKDFKCRSFILCEKKCTTYDEKPDLATGLPKGCALYHRAVEPTALSDAEFDQAALLLKNNVEGGKLIIDIDSEKKATFKASTIKFMIHPFNQDDSQILYENVFDEHRLSEDSKFSFLAKSEMSNALECYRACVSEGAISCASFSYCPKSKKCTLSSVYLKVNDDKSLEEITLDTDCSIFKRKDLQFFTPNEGKVPQLKGYDSQVNVHSDDECATYCKRDNNCKSFEFCAKEGLCTLHQTHELQIWKPADQKPQCRHYSLKYSSDYEVLGNNIVQDDPNHQTVEGVPLEKCAQLCSEQVEQFNCKSFNYCPGPEPDESKSECQLNKLNNAVDGGPTKITPGCQHYWGRGQSLNPSTDKNQPDKVYLPLKYTIGHGFKSKVEATMVLNGIKTTIASSEVHNLTSRTGRLSVYKNGEITSYFYNGESGQIVELRGGNCQVIKTTEDVKDFETDLFWGWSYGSYIIGPGSIFFRDTQEDPVWVESTTIRGISCEMFEAFDPVDKGITIRFCFTDEIWNTATALSIRLPVYAEAKGLNRDEEYVDMTMHFMYFHTEIKNTDLSMITRGIGCDDLTATKPLPSILSQFSFEGEVLSSLGNQQQVTEVDNVKVMFDGTHKLLRFFFIDADKTETVIRDFNTGVSYQFNDKGSCTIGPLRRTIYDETTSNDFGTLELNPTGFLALDANFYYVGQINQRGIECDVWEAVRMNSVFLGTRYYRIVQTYYFSTKRVDIVSEGDLNLGVPITLKMSLYIIPNDTTPVLWELNFFRFDESKEKDFSQEMNIENCFPEEFQNNYFVINFQTTEEKATLAKTNLGEFKKNVIKAIQTSAQVSPLRVAQITISFDQKTVYVQGKMLDRPPAYVVKTNTDLQKLGTDWSLSKAKNLEECATNCISDKNPKCTAFIYCQDTMQSMADCYRTSVDVTEKKDMPMPKETCSLYFRGISPEIIVEAPLSEAIKKLEADVKNGKLTFSVSTTNKDQITASNIDTSLRPFDISFSEHFETVQVEMQLVSEEESQTSMEVSQVSTAWQCYQRCLDEQSLSCASFSFCPNNYRCRLSSVYVGKDNKEEVTQATGCKVYRKEAIRFFDKYEGMSSGSTGEETLTSVNSSESCALACKSAKFTCRSFDYCPASGECVLNKIHALGVNDLQTSTRQCSHYSLKMSTEFIEYGRDIVVDPTSVTMEAISFEHCSKMCYEWEAFPCTSVNFCPQRGSDLAVCDINAKTVDDKNVVTKESDYCKNYQRIVPGKPGNKDEDQAVKEFLGVSDRTYSGVLASMFFLGIVLGVVGYMTVAYFKLKKARSDDVTVRFTNQE